MNDNIAAPAIILVRPQLGENIGACARAMLNFGLSDLRLVAPRDGWPNPEAWPRASGADLVLDAARVYATLPEAIADLGYVYATTVRPRRITKPVVTPTAAASEMRARAARSGIIFGPERAGLETDDLAVAHAVLSVPVNPDFGSLNLAQAVLLVAYEWFQTGDATPPVVLDHYAGPAPHAELEGLIMAVTDVLDAADYFNVAGRVQKSKRNIRNLLTRPAYSEDEVRTLRGIVHALAGKRRPKE
ncbi:MAG: RNA methyltransferase [Polymorphobacter sp.]